MSKNIIPFFRVIRTHKEVISYFIFSCIAAIVDTLVGYIFLKIFSFGVVYANTLGIVVSTGAHYLLVTRHTFHCRISFYSLFLYLVTFLAGIIVQDVIIWFFYDIAFPEMSDYFRFLFSKIISLGVSFFLLFFLRKKLYAILNKIQQTNKGDNPKGEQNE